MKRILFCAAIAAFATACTNEDDLVLNQDNSRTQGLTFDVTLAEGSTTRGELTEDNGTYPFFWYAETDRINVFANNVTNNGNSTVATSTVDTSTGAWTLSTAGVAKYKATKSEGTGQFTSIDDANTLYLKDFDAKKPDETTATIVATYGDVKVTKVASTVKDSKVVAGDVKELELTTTAATAEQTVAKANVVEAPMYSITKASKEEGYQSFGERANLNLIRPFPVIKFTTENTADYIKDFGKLTSVELTTLGIKKADGTFEVKPSLIVIDNDKKYTIKGDKATAGTGFTKAGGVATKVTLTDGTWTDNDAVYMTVAPVDRKDFKDKSKKEPLKVVYTFENITFTLDATAKDAKDFEKALQTDSNWTSIVMANGKPNAITELPALDINNYGHLVTNEKTLIVLSGKFKDILNKDGDKIIWGNDPTAYPALTDIKKIISKVDLADDELALLKKFTAVTDLTLAEDANIPANTFTANQATAMKHISLPKVTSIDPKFIANDASKAFAALDSISMPAYDFGPASVTKAFFNTAVASTLLKADISAVTTMLPKFGIIRTLEFTNYAKLKEITVMDGVAVAPNGFAGCEVLETINGKLDISAAPEVFKMEGTAANDVLESVEITGTVIPAGAFVNCTALETVLYNGAAIAPTKIIKNAFEGTTALKYMDLSQASEIGEYAFKASGIIANKEIKNAVEEILVVGVKSLATGIFEDCPNLMIVKFTEATVIEGKDVLKGTNKLVQVKFQKIFTLAANTSATYYDNVFSTNTDVTNEDKLIDFWTNPDQKGITGKEIVLSYKTGNTTTNKMFTFKSIQPLDE